jgi:glycosyltransferase involved in cell wall biosynthesis
MSGPRQIHLVTPGDHFSPRTGSAIPTVVHGLCGATPVGDPTPAVLVARGTYPDRYRSAEVLDYEPRYPTRLDHYLDPVLGRLGLPRRGARRSFQAALAGQGAWGQCIVLAHNAPQAIPLVPRTAAAVLYVHNQLLGTYGTREIHRILDPVAAVICVSDHLAGATRDHLPRTLQPRVAVVGNGVDVAFFSGPRLPRTGRLRITFVGRVIPDKGPHVLLDAARILARPDLEIAIVGRSGFSRHDPLSNYEKELRVNAARLPGPVTFRSFLPRAEVADVLRRTDVLVVPSIWPEPFGLTALEGMAAGAAVVATDAGGLPEAVGGGGVVLPRRDADALAATLAELAEDERELERLQAAGRARAAERTWDQVRAELDATLQKALA